MDIVNQREDDTGTSKFQESTEQHVLAQIWAPMKSGGRGWKCEGELGLPGRVFGKNCRNGHLMSSITRARRQSCVGVLELIMTSQKINYGPEVDKVCKALEFSAGSNLKSSEILDHSSTQRYTWHCFKPDCNEVVKNALAEILEILTVVCETHKLALAQTWVPCMHRSVLAFGGGLKKSCTSFDGSCNSQVCMSTTDVAFYVETLICGVFGRHVLSITYRRVKALLGGHFCFTMHASAQTLPNSARQSTP
ncbi:hypothetical protein GH714_006980 [Hevea brasiliensis]|uniref:NLP1-9 GAF domain-containing protein n=1 Tax=Hevea brasiliensis TaxID=3981 RepID=A0A6A6LDC1_HEVBR|nr:hypothetical protein GH714_006980 [Hevea brasiliensis]